MIEQQMSWASARVIAMAQWKEHASAVKDAQRAQEMTETLMRWSDDLVAQPQENQHEYLKAMAKAIYATTSKALQYQRVLAPVQKTALVRAVALGCQYGGEAFVDEALADLFGKSFDRDLEALVPARKSSRKHPRNDQEEP